MQQVQGCKLHEELHSCRNGHRERAFGAATAPLYKVHVAPAVAMLRNHCNPSNSVLGSALIFLRMLAVIGIVTSMDSSKSDRAFFLPIRCPDTQKQKKRATGIFLNFCEAVHELSAMPLLALLGKWPFERLTHALWNP